MGATGQANRERQSRVEEAMAPNPNGVRRRVFEDALEVYAGKGWITPRGYEAGKKLRAAWEGTERSDNYLKERVDSSPKPDVAVAVQIDRVSARNAITRKIPPEDWTILMTVVCEGQAIGRLPEYRGRGHERGKAHLRAALDRLAERLGK